MMMFDHLEQSFEIYLIDSFQEVRKGFLRYPQAEAHKAGLHAKPSQMLLIYLRNLPNFKRWITIKWFKYFISNYK